VSQKDIFAKCLDVPQEDAVVDSSLVDPICWWIAEFVDTREEETTLYPDEMGINQERADWAELGKFLSAINFLCGHLLSDFPKTSSASALTRSLKISNTLELFELNVVEFIVAEKQ
jgi:hypothetical protein